ncbi:hypothetical protein [Leisingera methylohalidivorans]|uniref:Uncharacterized protein n=1 Tax=Leisingera methylohalidivorans DSM 14336 TaxID=999552 RepID=V9VZ51_9RHOB|nr:hypothetical protein [Leisingera methylohalidivorans]AHD03054.1 hypothetical protein METH_09825 [Leisingera methylohalidivorans DSM 14336]
MEMPPAPEETLKAADVLRALMPDAGHLIQMPPHIDMLQIDFHSLAHWNQKAIEADQKFGQREGVLNI